MTLHIQLAPLISLLAGIGILILPRLLNHIAAGSRVKVVMGGIIHQNPSSPLTPGCG